MTKKDSRVKSIKPVNLYWQNVYGSYQMNKYSAFYDLLRTTDLSAVELSDDVKSKLTEAGWQGAKENISPSLNLLGKIAKSTKLEDFAHYITKGIMPTMELTDAELSVARGGLNQFAQGTAEYFNEVAVVRAKAAKIDNWLKGKFGSTK